MTMEIKPTEKSCITQSHVICVAQVRHWLSEFDNDGQYAKYVEELTEVQYFLQNMLDTENGIKQGYLREAT